jgi:hypothetical protein
MIISLKKLSDELKIKIPDLITRPIGRYVYEKVRESMKIIHDGEVVIIDFQGIRVADLSFIDEFIVRMVLDSRKNIPEFYIKVINLSDIAVINIESVFNSYYLMNNEKIAVITDRLINKSFFIGFLTETERDIINYLNVNKTCGIKNASEFLEINQSETEKILDGLYGLRLIRRRNDAGGAVYLFI